MKSTFSLLFFIFNFTLVNAQSIVEKLPDPLGDSPSPTYYFYPNGGQVIGTDLLPTDITYYTNYGRTKNFINSFINTNSYVFYKNDTIASTLDSIERIDQKLMGSFNTGPFEPVNVTQSTLNYFVGGLGNFSNIKGCEALNKADIYSNIDYEVSSNSFGITQSFKINPMGNVNDIIIKFTGAQTTTINPDGSLTIKGLLGSVTYRQPRAYLLDATNIVTFVAWTPTWTPTTNPNEYKFTIGSYTATKSLVITIDQGKDIFTAGAIQNLEWSTYFGGNNTDEIKQAINDAAGNLYTCGATRSTNYPIGIGAFITPIGYTNAVYTKFDNFGILIYSTVFGGNYPEIANTLALTPSGNIIVAGQTWSSNFITTPKAGAYNQAIIGGPTINHGTSGYDGFISEFNSSGTPVWSTYYGGNYDDYITKIKFNALGNLYAVGWSTSTNLPGSHSGSQYFQLCNNNINPVSTGSSYDTYTEDGFVLKLNSTTFNIDWGSCVGGLYGASGVLSNDGFNDLDFNPVTNDVYVTGYTFGNSYPVINNSAMHIGTPNLTGSQYAISQFNTNGQMLWAQYYGFHGVGKTIKFLPNGNYIVAGEATGPTFETRNDGSTFYQGSMFSTIQSDGGFGLFSSSNVLLHGSLLGASGYDLINDIKIDNHQNIYFVGTTDGNAFFNKPFFGAYGANNSNSNVDHFIFGLSPNLTQNFWSTYLGGFGSERNTAITIDNSNRLFLVGLTTSSTLFPLDNDGGVPYFQNIHGGGTNDGCVTRFNLNTFTSVGINEPENNSTINFGVYPNPTNSKLNLILSPNEVINLVEVYNTVGQLILSSNSLVIDVTSLAEGLYVIKIKTNTSIKSSKFIKE